MEPEPFLELVEDWLNGDAGAPKPPTERKRGRKRDFHSDDGAGIGASHQTGWAGLVAQLIQQVGESEEQREKMGVAA